MNKNPFAPEYDALPETLPIFPLSSALLLPHGQLPLNIFEPRYLSMIEDALGSHRMIGMIQPKPDDTVGLSNPPVYATGCAGKITEFSETPDGRYMITLTGICRFTIAQELDTLTHYRLVKPEWKKFEGDLGTKTCLGVNREKLEDLLGRYFEKEGMSCDFAKFEAIDDGQLMTALAMICPFEPREKQALLEEACCVERAKIFMTMLEMAIENGKLLDKSESQCH